MTGFAGATTTGRSRPDLLGIYLNDHLAVATGEVELARRTAGAHQSSDIGEALRRLAVEFVEDRVALLNMMAALGVPVRYYKVFAAWAAEKAGRLKLNGYVRGQSPLSIVVELEALSLSVEVKSAGWHTLRELAEHDGRLAVGRLDELLVRAHGQASILEKLRTRKAAEVFSVAAVSGS
jgi:hypothetical protein